MVERFLSAEIVTTRSGKQYHIGLGPRQVAPYIILVGDPARATRVSKLFDRVDVEASNREYRTYTGLYQGIPTTVMATGIGCDNTEIAVVELSQIVANPTFLRVGSCGALQKQIKLGHLVISSGALRLENTSLYFVQEGYPAAAHYEAVLALLGSARAQNLPHHLGITATAPGFYGAQARKVPGWPPRFPHLESELARMNVANFEMETSLLFTLASLRGFRAGAVCAVYANRHANKFIDSATKERAEGACIACGLGAVVELARMDEEKRQADGALHWTPDMRAPKPG
ncbi:MAG: nucleoside phosphorylase [Planctomycetes bacterium]|nr:nucleoside phosphorylase [Planctomycetota bacterium]